MDRILDGGGKSGTEKCTAVSRKIARLFTDMELQHYNSVPYQSTQEINLR